MQGFEKLFATIFGGILTLAIISVIISRRSQAPQAIQAFSSGLANVVSAAVQPVNTASTNGNLGSNPFSMGPTLFNGNSIQSAATKALLDNILGK